VSTITQNITSIAPAANPATMDRTTFSNTAAANVLGISGMTAELNTWAGQANAMVSGMTAIATGAALAIPLTFSTTTTDSDPGNGILRLDNATQNIATTIRTDLIGNDGSTWTDVINLFDDSTSTIKGFIVLVDLTDATKWLVFSVSALASPAGYKNISVACVAFSAANPFANGASLALKFTRNGDKGDTGATGTGITTQAVGFTATGGTTPKTLTIDVDLTASNAVTRISEYAGSTGGTTTAYTLTPTPALTAYADGQRFLFKANATNTGAGATFAISGLAALPSTMGYVALPVGALIINNFYWGLVEAGGTSFRISPYDARSVNGDTSNGLEVWAVGANIASATTLNLSTATGNLVHITGTTATSAVTMAPGEQIECIADGAWPLTYHATNNKLNTGGANYTCAAGDSVFFFYDGTTVYGRIVKADGTAVAVAAVAAAVAVRQTALGGPIDTSGLPTFLPATYGGLSIVSQNITPGAPFMVASANGFGATGAVDRIGYSSADLTWSGLTANSTNYLYVDIAGGAMTPGSTTLAPLYQYSGAPAVTANQATFNIAQMQMLVGNGSTALQTYRVFLGEAVAGASTITSTVSYVYGGYYDSGFTQNLPAASTLTIKNHNIGTEIRSEFIAECTTADGGYDVGDQIYPMTRPTNEYARLSLARTRNTIGVSTGATAAFSTSNKSTGGVLDPLTQNSWKWKIIAWRGW